MRYRKEFFDLQLRFARKVAELSGVPLERAVLDYTNIYVRLAIDRSFDPNSAVWLDYVHGLRGATDDAEWTYRFYLTRPESEPSGVPARFGCFSYTSDGGDRVRLHFENTDAGPGSPLAADRIGARQDELRRLFTHVRQAHGGVRHVAGVSWLYNLPAYRRLFPVTYLASARVAASRFRNMPLWGQFLDRHGAVKQAPAQILEHRLAQQSDLENLAGCFPLQPLAVEACVSDFYRSYGLVAPQ